MAVVADFDAIPTNITGGETVRFLDKSYKGSVSDKSITGWQWMILDYMAVTPYHTDDYFIPPDGVTAYESFPTGTPVKFTTTGTLPTGISAATTYYALTGIIYGNVIYVTNTVGGSVVTFSDNGTGTTSIAIGSTEQNPLVTFPTGTTDKFVDVTLTVSYDGGTASETKTSFIHKADGLTWTRADNYSRYSILIFDGEDGSDNAMVVNRDTTTTCNVFFTDLTIMEAIGKNSTASFTVYDMNASTATERSLLESTDVTPRYVVVLLGADVVFSGTISKSNMSKISEYDTSGTYNTYKIECDGDSATLSSITTKSSSVGKYIGYSSGRVVDAILEPESGEPSWKGLLEYWGNHLTYEVKSATRLSNLQNIIATTDYDWRSRRNFRRYAYSNWNSTDIFTLAGSYLSTNELVGCWLVVSPNADSYVESWGQITANDATTITATMTGAASVPAVGSGTITIIQNRVFDYAYELTQPDPQLSIYSNRGDSSSTVHPVYGYDDNTESRVTYTKVTATGKDSSGITQTSTISAVTAWVDSKRFPDKMTFLTNRMEGYIYLATGGGISSSLYVYGHGYALQSGDVIDLVYKDTSGTIQTETHTVSSIADEYTESGIAITKVTISTYFTHTFPADTMMFSRKLYVDTTDWTTVGHNILGEEDVNVQAEGNDTVYGDYITTNGMSDRGTNGTVAYPHYPGCLVYDAIYTESSPQTGSPLELYGTKTKTIPVDFSITKSDLDVYAANIMMYTAPYTEYAKGTAWMVLDDCTYRKKPGLTTGEVSEYVCLHAGDKIALYPGTGESAVEWKVLSVSHDAIRLICTFELGFYERNILNIMDSVTVSIRKTLT